MDAPAVSLIISALALAVSIYVGRRQVRLQQQVTKIETARREEEVASRLVADVSARFESYIASLATQAKAYNFVLLNQGPARAHEASFEILAPAKGLAPTPREEGHHLPVTLDRGQKYVIACTVPQGTAPSVEVVLRWTDGRGSQKKTLTLTISEAEPFLTSPHRFDGNPRPPHLWRQVQLALGRAGPRLRGRARLPARRVGLPRPAARACWASPGSSEPKRRRAGPPRPPPQARPPGAAGGACGR